VTALGSCSGVQWRPFSGMTQFTTGAPIGTVPVPLGVTKVPIAIEFMSFISRNSDQLVAHSGATVVNVIQRSNTGAIGGILVNAESIAFWNSTPLGSAIGAGAGAYQRLALWPAGTVPGWATASVGLYVYCDAGTVTGTIRWQGLYAPLGAWT
jgi:hypothetical protein